MDTKSYLSQIGRLNKMIVNKLEEIENLRCMVNGTHGANCKEKTQNFTNGDSFSKTVNRIVDLEKTVDNMAEKRSHIVSQIENIEDTEKYDILAKKYILGKDLKAIAADENISLRHAIRLHGQAIRAFEEQYGAGYLPKCPKMS